MRIMKEPYHLFADPIRYYNAMLDDIEAARDYIYIETYRVGNDVIGTRFNDALVKKAKQGVEIKLLIDYWGGNAVNNNFFNELKASGGEVRFFEKIKFNTDIFTRGHKRNHRKLMLIDDEISYIGSSNITEYNLNWRESVLRMKGPVALTFKRVFKQDWKIYNTYVFVKENFLRLLRHAEFEVIRDMPSITKQRIMKRFLQLIKKAERSIHIITPYFLPGFMIRKELMDAARRGVEVNIIFPMRSDVGLVDVLRNKYSGQLHLSGINIRLFQPHNLHAKLFLVDDEVFVLGSPNFDYRSFRYMYEIVLQGTDDDILCQVRQYISDTLESTTVFNYEHWKRRPLISKIFEWLLLPVRHLL
jgi:cardiolipin synthase A/B